MPPFPKFDLDSSPLLCALVDDVVPQVWAFYGDGEYATARHLKDEADERVGEVLRTWTDDDLAALAADDPWARVGLADVGTDTAADPVAVRRGRLAMRVVELGLADAQRELWRRSLGDPTSADRAYRSVSGLWDSLCKRHFLLPLTPDRAPRDLLGDDGYLFFGDHCLFPHPFLSGYRELFWDLCELAHQGLEVRVAIDPFRVVAREEVPLTLLEDYWFGVKLTRATLDSVDPADLGSTVHWRNPDSALGRQLEPFFPLIATEFDWSMRDDSVKILQVEEVTPGRSHPDAGGWVLNRYLHSERDTQVGAFTHLDGALKGYPTSGYRPTREDPLARRGKASVYRKLFRVDGRIPDAAWGNLVGRFYRQNELVGEYFGDWIDERVAPV